MLIIYPDPNADSFITVANATIVIDTYTLDGAKWSAKSVSEQEVLLRIAYRDIIDHTDPTTYPDPIDACVSEAQALMAVHDVVNSISGGVTDTSTAGAIKKQKAGPIEREFYDTKTTTAKRSTSRVPAQAQACLERLGYSLTNITGLTQVLLGRS